MQNTLNGQTCINHPGVEAAYSCQDCHVPLCKTCVITFYGEINYCPRCAGLNEGKLSPGRKKKLLYTYIAAGIGLFILLLFFSVAFITEGESGSDAIYTVLGYIILGTSIAGTAMGFGNISKKQKNPPAVWVAAVWNLVILLIYLLMIIIGIMIQ